VIQVQIQALLAVRAVAGKVTEGSNIGSNIKVAKLLVFNRKAGKVEGFIITYRLYLRIKIRETTVKKQVQ